MKRFHPAAIACILVGIASRGLAQGGAAPGAISLETPVAEPARNTEVPVPAIAKPDERPKGATEVTAREAMFDNRIHLGTFSGDVLVKDPEFGLSCERLSVYLKKPPAKAPDQAGAKPSGEESSGIERAVAEGGVVITQEKKDADGKLQRYTGRGAKAVFDNATGILTLSGWPQISQSIGGAVSKQITAREAGCVIILNRAGKIEVKGYHTSTLQDAEGRTPGSR